MTIAELETKFEKVENIEKLMAELKAAADEKEVQNILDAYGLDLSTEELAQVEWDEDELNVEALDQVAGGCKCKGILKRVVTNFLCWLSEKATGKKMTCPDCGK